MALPIYDEFVKQYPDKILFKFVSNAASTSNSTKLMEDFTKATDKLYNKYPDLKEKLRKIISDSLPSHSGSYKITTRISNLVNALKEAERHAMYIYGDDIKNLENIDEILKAAELTDNEITRIRFRRTGTSLGKKQLSYNNSRTVDLLEKRQKAIYERLYNLDPDNEMFKNTNYNTLINGPLIKVKKSNFKNNTEKNLLTMPSREKELEGLFGGKRKTTRKRKSNKKTRKL